VGKRKTLSKKMRFEVFKRDKFICQYCGRLAPDVILEIDHINPIANGGDNSILNLITACRDCNRGKGKRLLTESEELKKQQTQLQELSERKEQLEMMIEWRKELNDLHNQEVQAIADLFTDNVGYPVTEHGKENIKKWIKKYTFNEVWDSTEISIERYYQDTSDSAEKAFSYIPRICVCKMREKKDPALYWKNYIVKMIRNRYSYFEPEICRRYLDILVNDENDFEELKDMVQDCRNWTIFRRVCEGRLQEYGN
jgi:hypothetical protein